MLGLGSLSSAGVLAVAAALTCSWASTLANCYLTGARLYGHAMVPRILRGIVVSIGTVTAAVFADAHLVGVVDRRVRAAQLGVRCMEAWSQPPARQPIVCRGHPSMVHVDRRRGFQAANLSLVATLSAQAEFGELEVTEFAVVQRWTLILTFAASALAPTFISRMAVATNGSSRQSARARRRLFYTYGLFTAVPALGVFLLADQIVAATTPTVPGAAWPVRLAAVGVGARLANQLLGNTAVAEDRWKMWLASDLVLAAGLLASGGIAARSYGAPGAVLAASTAYAVSAAFLAVAPRLVHRNAGTRLVRPKAPASDAFGAANCLDSC